MHECGHEDIYVDIRDSLSRHVYPHLCRHVCWGLYACWETSAHQCVYQGLDALVGGPKAGGEPVEMVGVDNA